jgi:hypothetical protein
LLPFAHFRITLAKAPTFHTEGRGTHYKRAPLSE